MPLTLSLLPDPYTFIRLPPAAPIPAWAHAPFSSITRTHDELSIVCPTSAIPAPLPAEARAEPDFRLLKLHGPLPFSLTGIIASIASPLAQAHISLVPIATFDTDYILIRSPDLPAAIAALRRAGHTILE
jgi:hypothetical protein